MHVLKRIGKEVKRSGKKVEKQVKRSGKDAERLLKPHVKKAVEKVIVKLLENMIKGNPKK